MFMSILYFTYMFIFIPPNLENKIILCTLPRCNIKLYLFQILKGPCKKNDDRVSRLHYIYISIPEIVRLAEVFPF